jgi:hypothetical protein
VIFASPAAIGAGLQVAACALEHEAKIGAAATVLSGHFDRRLRGRVLRPLLRAHAARHPFRLGLLAGTAAILVLSVLLAVAGVDVSVCLVVMVLVPATTVVGYETSVTATSRTRWSGCDRRPSRAPRGARSVASAAMRRPLIAVRSDKLYLKVGA